MSEIERKEAALQMLDLMISRKPHPKLTAFRAAVESWPNLPPGSPDYRVSMNFNRVESDFGGSSWDLRGVRLRAGVLELITGFGVTDGMSGSDQREKPTDDIEHYLSVLSSPERTRGGPYL